MSRAALAFHSFRCQIQREPTLTYTAANVQFCGHSFIYLFYFITIYLLPPLPPLYPPLTAWVQCKVFNMNCLPFHFCHPLYWICSSPVCRHLPDGSQTLACVSVLFSSAQLAFLMSIWIAKHSRAKFQIAHFRLDSMLCIVNVQPL